MTGNDNYGQRSMNVGNRNGMNGRMTKDNKKITILIVRSKPQEKGNRSRWPALFVSVIMMIGILAMMPVQAASPGMAIPTAGPAPVNLGTAGDFVILAQTGITTTGVTSITGDIGVSPIAATAITGFGLVMDPSGEFSTTVPPTLVTGKVYAANYADPTPAKMGTAVGDMGTAYTDAAGRLIPDYVNLYSGDVTGQTLTPGLWKWTTGLLISAAGVTISGAPSDVWIFQIAQDLTVASNAIVTLDGGAQASNIFWQVAGQAVLGTSSQFKGIILCQTQIVIQNGATLDGRALAQTAVTTDANMITVPNFVGENRAADGLWVERSNPDIILHWKNLTGNPTDWHIYYSSDIQNAFPGEWTMTAISGSARFWNHAGAYGDGLNWFYIVRGYDGAAESVNSTMGVKIHKAFSHNSLPLTNVNFISLPYNSMYRTARDVVIDLEGGDGAATSPSTKINVVGLWMPEYQCSRGYFDVPEYGEGWLGDNFAIPPGAGIYVSVLSDFNWIINGTDSSIQLEFTPNIAKTNIVYLSMPYTGMISTPSDIVAAIEGGNGLTSGSVKISSTGKWDHANQVRTSYYFDPVSSVWMGDNSIIAPGEGFYVNITSTFAWVPGLMTPVLNGAGEYLPTEEPAVNPIAAPVLNIEAGPVSSPPMTEDAIVLLDSSSASDLVIEHFLGNGYASPNAVKTMPAVNSLDVKSTEPRDRY